MKIIVLFYVNISETKINFQFKQKILKQNFPVWLWNRVWTSATICELMRFRSNVDERSLIIVLYQRTLFFLFLPEFFYRRQPQPLLPLQLHDVGHAKQVLLVPISGRKDDRLVQEVTDGVEQLVFLLDDATNFLKFLKKSLIMLKLNNTLNDIQWFQEKKILLVISK